MKLRVGGYGSDSGAAFERPFTDTPRGAAGSGAAGPVDRAGLMFSTMGLADDAPAGPAAAASAGAGALLPPLLEILAAHMGDPSAAGAMLTKLGRALRESLGELGREGTDPLLRFLELATQPVPGGDMDHSRLPMELGFQAAQPLDSQLGALVCAVRLPCREVEGDAGGEDRRRRTATSDAAAGLQASAQLRVTLPILGPLAVDISLSGWRLALTVYAAEPQTLWYLQADRRSLLDALGQDGFEADAVRFQPLNTSAGAGPDTPLLPGGLDVSV